MWFLQVYKYSADCYRGFGETVALRGINKTFTACCSQENETLINWLNQEVCEVW